MGVSAFGITHTLHQPAASNRKMVKFTGSVSKIKALNFAVGYLNFQEVHYGREQNIKDTENWEKCGS